MVYNSTHSLAQSTFVFLSPALQNNLDDYLSKNDDAANMYDRGGFRIPLGADVAGADTMRRLNIQVRWGGALSDF